MKSRVKILGLVLLLITVAASSTSGRASSPPPFPIEQCDDWLLKAQGKWINKHSLVLANLAQACYLSHLVQR